MTDSFRRPYVHGGTLVYLTDEEATEQARNGDLRRLRPGEVFRPIVHGETQIAPRPATGEAADTILGDRVRHPVPEVREREVP